MLNQQEAEGVLVNQLTDYFPNITIKATEQEKSYLSDLQSFHDTWLYGSIPERVFLDLLEKGPQSQTNT